MTPLNIADLRRRIEAVGPQGLLIPSGTVLAQIDLASRLKAAGQRLVGAVEACAVADRGGPPVNWDAVDASQDAMRAALAAAKDVGL